MQYLLMCCIDESLWAGTPASQRDGVMQDYEKLIQGLVENGKYLSGAKLRGSDAATTVRQRNGKPVITDGPFAETREQLGGYHVVECRDLDEAIAIAQRIPTLRVGGTVEVRPLDHATA